MYAVVIIDQNTQCHSAYSHEDYAHAHAHAHCIRMKQTEGKRIVYVIPLESAR